MKKALSSILPSTNELGLFETFVFCTLKMVIGNLVHDSSIPANNLFCKINLSETLVQRNSTSPVYIMTTYLIKIRFSNFSSIPRCLNSIQFNSIYLTFHRSTVHVRYRTCQYGGKPIMQNNKKTVKTKFIKTC
jgi:hypothetical protein